MTDIILLKEKLIEKIFSLEWKIPKNNYVFLGKGNFNSSEYGLKTIKIENKEILIHYKNCIGSIGFYDEVTTLEKKGVLKSLSILDLQFIFLYLNSEKNQKPINMKLNFDSITR
jgi:hypothetical protein